MSFARLIIVSVATLLCVALVQSQEQSFGKVHGYVFGDYFYMVGADTAAIRGAGQYSAAPKDFQAFQFRRLYLYYDHTFSEKFFAQFLLEGNDKTFEPGGKYGMFVKSAYLEWKGAVPLGSIAIGLVPTPTWSLLSEKVWNYRSIEKTIIDFRGFGSASDIGLQLRGKFDRDGTFSYVAMIGNGTGQKPENNKYKKYYGSLSIKPKKELVLEGYIDYEPAALEKNKTTLKGFAGYQTESFTFGVEAFQQTQAKAGAAAADATPFGISFFAWARVLGVDALNAFVRFDMFDPNTKVRNAGYKENFIVAGFDYMPIPNVHLMPNIWINSYSAKGGGSRDSDVAARITLFYVYK